MLIVIDMTGDGDSEHNPNAGVASGARSEAQQDEPFDVVLSRFLNHLYVDPQTTVFAKRFVNASAMGEWIKSQTGNDLETVVERLTEPHDDNDHTTTMVDRAFCMTDKVLDINPQKTQGILHRLAIDLQNIDIDAASAHEQTTWLPHTPFTAPGREEALSFYTKGLRAILTDNNIKAVFDPKDVGKISSDSLAETRRAFLEIILSGSGILPWKEQGLASIIRLGRKPAGYKFDPFSTDATAAIEVFSPVIGRATK